MLSRRFGFFGRVGKCPKRGDRSVSAAVQLFELFAAIFIFLTAETFGVHLPWGFSQKTSAAYIPHYAVVLKSVDFGVGKTGVAQSEIAEKFLETKVREYCFVNKL